MSQHDNMSQNDGVSQNDGMSQHDGVSCDSCLKRNFCGKRYKCLICLDYDLCSTCHDTGTLSGRHTSNHPMQCILTRDDIELFFAGELVSNDQLYSFTCPICGRLGFTSATLFEHVRVSHSSNSIQVVCPICATLPDGEPNQVTTDFLNHLNVEHRSNNNTNRELEEPQIVRIRQRHVRMNNRNRRSQLLNSTSTATSSNSRDALDPIAQLLSQLSDARRINSSSSNGQNHMWQFPFDRQSNQSNRAGPSFERIIQRQRRQLAPSQFSSLTSGGSNNESSSNQSMPYVVLDSAPSPSANNNLFNNVNVTATTKINSSFLLNTCALMLSENELKKLDTLKADRSLFVQELIFACLSDSVNIDRFLAKSPNVDDETKNQQPLECTSSTSDSDAVLKSSNNDSNNKDFKDSIVNSNDQPDGSNSLKINQDKAKMNISMMEQPDTKNSADDNVICTATATTVAHSYTTAPAANSLMNEPDHNGRQKSMPSLVTSGTSAFIVSQTAPTVNSHRNKVSKVRSSPAIAPSLTIRSSLTTVPGGPVTTTMVNVVSPGGRRKIFKQPTEPPPHYD